MKLSTRTRRLLVAVTGSAALGAALIAPSGALAVETCMGYTATIVGTAGNDTVYGNPYATDVVSLLGGNDAYIEDSSNDVVCLGTGDDQLTSSIGSFSGNDAVQGGPGNDVIAGFSGSDTLIGGDGDDQLFGNDGNDTLNGEAGDDYLVGGLGSDAVNGNGGLFDQCYGEFGFMGCEVVGAG
jgi:Ca2+-binding RTX toxin-like protein